MAKLTLPRGIRARGDKFFVDVTLQGQRRTATCKTLAEAVVAQEQLRTELELGSPSTKRRANARSWTLREALNKTCAIPAKEGWKGAKGAVTQIINVEDAIAFIGEEVTVDQIDRTMIDAWLNDCEERGNSGATLNRKLSAISKVLKIAVAFGGLEAMPHMPRQRTERVSRVRQLTRTEEETLLQQIALHGSQDHADAVAVLIDTGLRCSELWNVRSSDLNFDTRVLLVYGADDVGTKNGTVRSVVMTKRVLEIMSRRSDMVMHPFPYNNPWIRHAWDKARAAMGLAADADFTPHVCRHTCCSRLVSKGIPLPNVQKWMGHKALATTLRYSHMLPTDLLHMVDALE